MHTIHLTIASAFSPLFVGDVKEVRLPGADGDMTVLAHHEALVSTLRKGTITVVDTDGKIHEFPVEHGALEIANNHATVLL